MILRLPHALLVLASLALVSPAFAQANRSGANEGAGAKPKRDAANAAKQGAKPADRSAPKQGAKPADRAGAKQGGRGGTKEEAAGAGRGRDQPARQAIQPGREPAKPAAKRGEKPSEEAVTGAAGGAKAGGENGPTLIGRYGEWGAYWGVSGGKKVCFALAQPQSSQMTPANAGREPAYLFISLRPSEKVQHEIATLAGYGFKPNADASIEIGGLKIAMQTHQSGGWVKSPAEEAKLIAELKTKADLTVRGTAANGAVSIDRYSLRGAVEAFENAAKQCRAP